VDISIKSAIGTLFLRMQQAQFPEYNTLLRPLPTEDCRLPTKKYRTYPFNGTFIIFVKKTTSNEYN